jgi:DNA-binding response OmpR family regulator
MNLPAILIVDDEPDILFTLRKCFSPKDFRVVTAENGYSAIERLKHDAYQIMILDLNMAPVSGLEVLKSLRNENQETVVIILTAFSTLESAIEAIHLGAFDYLVKPVDIAHIRKRVAEGMKQYERNHILIGQQAHQTPEKSQIFHTGNLTLDLDQRVAEYDGKRLDLTTIEFKILQSLVKEAPKPVCPVALVKMAMGYECAGLEASGIIKFHIHQLRQKLESTPQKPQHIKTVRFEGYLWCE